MITKRCAIGAAALWLWCAATALAAGEYQWGQPVNGLEVGIKLTLPDRTQWHPGELIEFEAAVRATNGIQVPAVQMPEWMEEHLVTPDGKEYIRNLLRRYDAEASDWHQIWSWTAPTGLLKDPRQLRLSDGGLWYAAKSKTPAEISRRLPGKYRMWLQCDVVYGLYPPKNAWRGTATSAEITWGMQDFPANDLHAVPTKQDEMDIAAWCNDSRRTNKSAQARLDSQVILTENEGLAERLLEVAKGGGDSGDAALDILKRRAGRADDGEEGIDAAYLKEWARWALGFEDAGKNGPALQKARIFLGDDRGLEAALVYLKFHADDREVRDCMLQIAERSCRLQMPNGANAGDAPDGLRRTYPPLARRVLLKLNVLKAGMSADDVTQILGPPSRSTLDQLSWVLRPAAEASPAISCEVKDGKVVKWMGR